MTDHPPIEALYAYWRTSAAYRVRVALGLKGLAVPERIVDLDHGGQRDPDFLKVNPMGAIPALVVEGSAQPLTQSLAILEYIEEIAPTPPLLPSDPLGRARVRSLALMLAADTHPFITPRVRSYLTTLGGFDAPAFKAWQTHWLTTGLRAFETRLTQEAGASDYCHGDTISIADICLCSIRAVMPVFGIQVDDTPTIDAIVARCLAQDAFRRADPYAQEGAPARPA